MNLVDLSQIMITAVEFQPPPPPTLSHGRWHLTSVVVARRLRDKMLNWKLAQIPFPAGDKVSVHCRPCSKHFPEFWPRLKWSGRNIENVACFLH